MYLFTYIISGFKVPGPEGSQGNSDFLFIGIAFFAMTLMYLFRPNSMRQGYGDDVKPRNLTVSLLIFFFKLNRVWEFFFDGI